MKAAVDEALSLYSAAQQRHKNSMGEWPHARARNRFCKVILLAMIFVYVRDVRPGPPQLSAPLHIAVWSVLFVGWELQWKGSDVTDELFGSFAVLRKAVFLKIQQ